MNKPSLADELEAAPHAVDESLLDAMLALSPEERLRQNDRMVRTILLLLARYADREADQSTRLTSLPALRSSTKRRARSP